MSYNENPELALSTLEKIAEEIPSGVSSLDVWEVCTFLKSGEEVTAYLHKTIADGMMDNLQKLWLSQNIEQKLKAIKNCTVENKSKRPLLSSQEMYSYNKARALKRLKQDLETKITKIKDAEHQLENWLRDTTKQIMAQTHSMQNFKFI